MDAPQYVIVDVPSGYFFDWMSYYTHHSDMDAPQYVHDDVPAENFCEWMSYYTYHSDMDAPQYVHVDVPSVHTCSCMSYYTHHKDMYVPQYVNPVERRKGLTLLFYKKRNKHNEMEVTNQLCDASDVIVQYDYV